MNNLKKYVCCEFRSPGLSDVVNTFDICFLESTYSWSILSPAISAETSTCRHSADFPVPVEECLLTFRTKSLRIDVLRLTILVNDLDAVFGHTHGDDDSRRRGTFEIEVFILLTISFSASYLKALIAGWGKIADENKKTNFCRIVGVCFMLCAVCCMWRVSRTILRLEFKIGIRTT